MRYSAIFPLLSALLHSRVFALPYSAPCSSDNQGIPSQRSVTNTLTDTYITGVPSPSSSDDAYITGVPAPSSTKDGYITGVPAPSSTGDGYVTGVPAPSSTCIGDDFITDTTGFSSGTGYTTGVPAPSSTNGPFSNTTSLPDISSISTSTEPETSTIPTPSQPSSCRPKTWTREGQAPSVGKLRAALIFVDFPDAPATVSPNVLYEEFSSKPAELYKQMSYGKLDLEIVPLLDQFYRMPADSSSYNYSRDLTTELHLKYITDAVTAAGSAITFTDIHSLYIMTNTEATEISFSTSTKTLITATDGTTISNSITYGQDLYFSWGYKTVNHETGHTMGLPDLYPYAGGDVPQWVGGYDIMGLIGGQSPDYFAWHKWQLDWVEDSQVDCIAVAGTTTHTLSPIEIAGVTSPTKAIAIPINGTAYVMVEVRSTFGIDEEACGAGVLLYTADSAVGSGDGPIRVIDTKISSSNHACTADKGEELNDAPLKAGEEMDTGLGVVVRVLSMDGEDYVVEIESTI